MIGKIVRSSSLNSFSSICYCVVVLGVHAYSSYKAIQRYEEAESRAWPGTASRTGSGSWGRNHGPPVESETMLALTILSLLLMPLFCVTCVFKVGNLANDGVKLGRDHALGCASDTTKDCSTRSRGIRRLWKIACPVSQTIHVIAAFLILLPETLLTSVEIKYGYKSTDAAWRSDLEFLYPVDRAFYSEIRSSVNAVVIANASHVLLDTPHHIPVASWGDRAFDVHVSIAFANLCLALTCFLVRYASVFWYTNKALSGIMALQLLAMALTSVFSFSCFSTLYCVSCNHRLYPNASLSLRCGAVLVLYLAGGAVLLASPAIVFEYGVHYFHEKFEVVTRHREPESYVKKTLITTGTGLQGYVPHVCAMVALVLSAAFKGPLLYDLVNLMRLTGDEMLLSGVVCEVCYMVLWLLLWFGLTVKQQWQFRILDYVAMRPPPAGSVVSEDSVRSNHMDRGDGVTTDSLTRNKRLSGRENFTPQRYLEPVASAGAGTASSCEEPSEVGTDEGSENITSAAEMALGLEGGNSLPDRNTNFRRSARNNRRVCGQRVTFDESVRSKGSSTDGGAQGPPARPDDGVNQLNVTADVHSSEGTNSSSSASNDSGHADPVVMRQRPVDGDVLPLSREYRNSIRNKCGEIYSSTNNLSHSPNDSTVVECPAQTEPLQTLMSSFRDKVRESSLAASTFKERERHMLEQFDYLDASAPNPVQDNQVYSEVDMRRCLVAPDEAEAVLTNSLDRHCRDVPLYPPPETFSTNGGIRYTSNYASDRCRPRSKSYDRSSNEQGGGNRPDNSALRDGSSSSLPRNKSVMGHNSSLSSDEGHRSSFSASTHESSDLSLSIPPAMEDIQRSRGRLGSCGLERRSMKDSYMNPQHQSSAHHNTMVGVGRQQQLILNPRPLQVLACRQMEMQRRDSANYSLTSSQETSSNESDNGHGLCSQV